MKQPESGRSSGRFYRTLLSTDMLSTSMLSTGMLCLVIGTLPLAACGQKGALYLPDQPPPPSKPFSDCDAPNTPCRQPGAGNANSTDKINNISTNTNSTPSAPAETKPAPVSSTTTPESSSP